MTFPFTRKFRRKQSGGLNIAHIRRTSMTEFDLLVPSSVAAKFLGITRGRVLELARSGEILGHATKRGKQITWRFLLSELAKTVIANRPMPARRRRGIID